MKRCYLDANVLVFFKDEDSSYHRQSVTKITGLVGEKAQLFISPLVLDELLYVLNYLLRNKNERYTLLEHILSDILQIPQLEIISTPIEKEAQQFVIKYMERYNLKPRDAYHLLTMKYNDVTHFLTFDSDFEKVFEKAQVKKI